MRFITALIAVKDHSQFGLSIIVQHSNDFFLSVSKALNNKLLAANPEKMPRFRQSYSNEIGIEHVDAAQKKIHAQMEVFIAEITKILEKFRAVPGSPVVRMGIGMYSFNDTPLL